MHFVGRRLALVLVAPALLLAACSSPPPQASSHVSQQSSHVTPGTPKLSTLVKNTYVSGPLLSKNLGPFMVDRFGRVVTLHGVNAVYKRAPYTLTVEPGQPNSLAESDAARIAKLGFNVVRVGVIWAGIEPGSGGPNQPQICNRGTPSDPHIWNQQVASSYIAQVAQVVRELGLHHVYSLIDMHQDVWSSVFGGEGAPAWATCTDGLPIPVTKGRWSDAYGERAEINAWNNFWNNDVVGGLQEQYQRAWAAVASAFRSNPWVVGYDPINEPSAMSNIVTTETYEYSASLSCLYAGRSEPLYELDSKQRISCPSQVPFTGLIKRIVTADPVHLVFPEVDNATNPHTGHTLFIARTPTLPGTVYNFHDYCPYRSGVTGNPSNPAYCSEVETTPMVDNMNRRALYATKSQPTGPAIMMTEFGATNNYTLAALIALDAQNNGLSWAWWAWKYYDDPTGSSDEAIVTTDGSLSASAPALTGTYAMAIAGVPVDGLTVPLNGEYSLLYTSNPSIKAPTSIHLDPLRFNRYSYCVYANGATITSRPNARIVTLENNGSSRLVGVRIVPGKCL